MLKMRELEEYLSLYLYNVIHSFPEIMKLWVEPNVFVQNSLEIFQNSNFSNANTSFSLSEV